jgi:hypothetical protein
MFHDLDTVDTGTYYRYTNHYTCNPRIFPDNWEAETQQDGSAITGPYITNRKLSNIKPSSVFLFWDAPQSQDWNNNAYEQATEIDGNELEFDSYLFLNSPVPSSFQYNRPVIPGGIGQSQSATICAAQQKKLNQDLSLPALGGVSYFNSHLRFRHMGNTVLNALCVDGHVENRTVGTFMLLDVCIKAPG